MIFLSILSFFLFVLSPIPPPVLCAQRFSPKTEPRLLVQIAQNFFFMYFLFIFWEFYACVLIISTPFLLSNNPPSALPPSLSPLSLSLSLSLPVSLSHTHVLSQLMSTFIYLYFRPLSLISAGSMWEGRTSYWSMGNLAGTMCPGETWLSLLQQPLFG